MFEANMSDVDMMLHANSQTMVFCLPGIEYWTMPAEHIFQFALAAISWSLTPYLALYSSFSLKVEKCWDRCSVATSRSISLSTRRQVPLSRLFLTLYSIGAAMFFRWPAGARPTNT